MDLIVNSDKYFMQQALKQAEIAFESKEIPVGTVIVCNGQIIARAHNQIEMLNDVTAHAEILAITSAANFLRNKYLQECTLYTTLEPCSMCAGAILWSKIGKIVYAASDEKHGFMRFGKEMLHPSTKIEFGLLHDECSILIKNFFDQRR